jgi:hypothetical protein
LRDVMVHDGIASVITQLDCVVWRQKRTRHIMIQLTRALRSCQLRWIRLN